jgi:methionine synthase II (cobalamin-independent)
MFGTLLGGLPSPESNAGDASADPIAIAVRAQEAAGLEPITDGRLGASSPFEVGERAFLDWREPLTLDAWRSTAALTTKAVKQSLPGPYSIARRAGRSAKARERAAMAAAEALHHEATALAASGCPLIEIEETEAHRIGDDAVERRLFRAAHRRLAEGLGGTHMSLSIVGGSAWDAGPATILDAPYASLAVDLIAGPDNWRLVVRTPGDRGIVAGALATAAASDEGPEVLLWAAQYAASTGARGPARVGLGTAGGLSGLTWEQALAKLERLGRAAHLAGLPPGEELASSVNPASISARSAAVGRRTIRR